MTNLTINGHNVSVEAPGDTPLLWVIREQLQMTGTKFGCGTRTFAARAPCIRTTNGLKTRFPFRSPEKPG
jgi:aerobic-type carbon monoxide dehydrogenase small subunit (CoxS/CutS family)